MPYIEKLTNANHVERVVIDNQQNKKNEQYLVAIKSGNQLHPQELEHSMSDWNVRIIDDKGVGIETNEENKFDNCHKARYGEYRHGKQNAIYGIIFVFELSTLKYIGQGYILKTENNDGDENYIIEGIQDDDQHRDLTLAKKIMETVTGQSWKLADEYMRIRYSTDTWLGANNGSNYVYPSDYEEDYLKLVSPEHSDQFKFDYAELSCFSVNSYLEEYCDPICESELNGYRPWLGEPEPQDESEVEDEPNLHCHECYELLSEGFWVDKDNELVCADCAEEMAEEELPDGAVWSDKEGFIENKLEMTWYNSADDYTLF